MAQEILAPRIDHRSTVQSDSSGGRWPGPVTIAAGLFAVALTVTVMALDVPPLDPHTAPLAESGGKLARVASAPAPTNADAGAGKPIITREKSWDGGIADIVAWLDRAVAGND